MDDQPMTKAERDELAKLVRRQEKLLKEGVGPRASELKADFERHITPLLTRVDSVWEEVKLIVVSEVREANERIAERCEALGVPAPMRPTVTSYGTRRIVDHRDELLRAAAQRLAAMQKEAALAIERWSVEMQRVLLTGELDSGDVRALLDSAPSLATLMPTLLVPELEPYESESSDEEPHDSGGLDDLSWPF